MKILWLLLPLAALSICACQKKAISPGSETTPAPQKIDAPTPAPPPPVAKEAPLPEKATPEQLASTVRVRVAFGGMPPRETAGALLHRDAIADKTLAEGKQRFVLARLTGWQEAQVRNAAATMVVYRHKVNAMGDTGVRPSRAHLIQFDDASKLALLTYNEDFDYIPEAGFHLDPPSPDARAYSVLRTVGEAGAEPAPAEAPPPPTPAPMATPPVETSPRNPAMRQFPGRPMFPQQMQHPMMMYHTPVPIPAVPFSVQIGAYRPTEKSGDVVKFASGDQAGDEGLLAVGAPDRLLGFVFQGASGAREILPVTQAAIEIQVPQVKATAMRFGRMYFPNLEFDISTEAPGGMVPKELVARLLESPTMSLEAATQPLANGTFAPIDTQLRSARRWDAATGILNGGLNAPGGGMKKTYLVQLEWPAFHGSDPPKCYGRPFLVELEARPGGMFPTIQGLEQPVADAGKPADAGKVADAGKPEKPAPAEAAPEAAAAAGPGRPGGPGGAAAAGEPAKKVDDPEARKFALNARVRNAYPIAGGREILFEFGEAPHWKRFSFEKLDWLPLPPGDDANIAIAGNLSSLFVLDFSTGVVGKYRLSDLEPQGKTSLPTTGEYAAILAGANTDHAPVHVLTGTGALVLAPETLERLDAPASGDRMVPAATLKFTRGGHFAITGDGLCITGEADARRVTYFYNNNATGLESNFLGSMNGSPFPMFETKGVSAAYRCEPDGSLKCVARPAEETPRPGSRGAEWRDWGIALTPNSPILFRFHRETGETVPPKPPHLACISYYDTAPFAEFDVPELTGLRDLQKWNQDSYAFFDPATLRIATLDLDRRNLFVRQLGALDQRDQPVLLNWPDTSIERGGQFQFKPRLLGGKQFRAQVWGRAGLPQVNDADGTVQFPLAKTEVDSFLLMNLVVAGAKGSDIPYPVPLHVAGPEWPFVAPVSTEMKELNMRGAGVKTLGNSSRNFRVLPTTWHVFNDPIVEIKGPVSGCAILLTKAGRVDFFSLEHRKVVGAAPLIPGAQYYPAAGALLEYDPGQRNLTRIEVPDGRRTAVLELPRGIQLEGIGAGIDPNSPVTLVVTGLLNSPAPTLGDLPLKFTGVPNAVVIVDGKTLRSSGWTQPVPVREIMRQTGPPQDIAAMVFPMNQRPAVLPASRDGRIVTLPKSLLVLTPTYAAAQPLDNSEAPMSLSGWRTATGSLSGLITIDGNGDMFRAGQKFGESLPNNVFGGTPCGRYRLEWASGIPGGMDRCLQVRLTDDGRPLMLGARFHIFSQFNTVTTEKGGGLRVVMLGDKGPLALLSDSGRALQLTEFNIPEIARDLLPTEFHVVSQPVPCLFEGDTMRYQILVNNPAAVTSCRLVTPLPGALVSARGLLTFTAPQRTNKVTRVQISVELVGTNGQNVLHEFPIYILPVPHGGMSGRLPSI